MPAQRAMAVFVTGLCALAPVATAQDAVENSPGEVEEPVLAQQAPLKFSLTVFGEHAFNRDMGDGGDVSTTRDGFELGFRDRVGEQGGLSLSLRATGVHHDFDDVPRLFNGADNAESDLYAIRLGGVYSHQIDEQWSWLAGGGIQVTGGKDTLGEDALAGAFFAAGRKQINENFGLALGVTFITRLEDDPIVVPFIGVDWRINDRLTLSSDALGLELRAQLEDDLALRVYGEFDTEEYRLDDDTTIPEGVLQENWVDVGLGLDWTPSPQWVITADLGIRAFDRFKTQDSDGDDVSADTADPTWFVGLGATFRF